MSARSEAPTIFKSTNGDPTQKIDLTIQKKNLFTVRTTRTFLLKQKGVVLFAIVLFLIQDHTIVQSRALIPASKRSSFEVANVLSEATEATTTSNNMSTRGDLDFLDDLRRKYPHQPTFLQAVEEMALALSDLFDGPDGDFYQRAFLAMAEPERIIAFRVSWMDDNGKIRFNRGWRVQFSRYVTTR